MKTLFRSALALVPLLLAGCAQSVFDLFAAEGYVMLGAEEIRGVVFDNSMALDVAGVGLYLVFVEADGSAEFSQPTVPGSPVVTRLTTIQQAPDAPTQSLLCFDAECYFVVRIPVGDYKLYHQTPADAEAVFYADLFPA